MRERGMTPLPTSCPACRGRLTRQEAGSACAGCSRWFPDVEGLPDLRLASDRYLDLEAERAKAQRLARFEASSDVLSLAGAYYGMTDDVDERRRARFLAHIAGAEVRGEALAALLPRNGPILEVGTGTGGLVAAAARSGRAIVGSDIATRWLLVGRRRLNDLGLHAPLVGAEAARLPWPNDSFEAVVADSVLEHLNDPQAALREWLRVVRPGGQVVIWSPNRRSIGVDPHVGLWGLGWMPRALVPRYVRWRRNLPWMLEPLSAHQAARMAQQAGWTDVRVSAVDVPPRWARSRWQKRAIGLYGAIKRHYPGHVLTTALGPLWQLRAVKRDDR